jgi:hypothetical protein
MCNLCSLHVFFFYIKRFAFFRRTVTKYHFSTQNLVSLLPCCYYRLQEIKELRGWVVLQWPNFVKLGPLVKKLKVGHTHTTVVIS